MNMDALRGRVIGAALEVHSTLGPGFLESLYEQALAIEFEKRRIHYERQKMIQVEYKGYPIGEGRLDFFVEDCLIVELKTVEVLQAVHISQVVSYLKALDLREALLLNFRVHSLKKGIRRVFHPLFLKS